MSDPHAGHPVQVPDPLDPDPIHHGEPAGAVLWGGRFTEPLDRRALRYTTSLPVDRHLLRQDVLGSMAHARMLGRQGIIPAQDADALVGGLADLLEAPPDLSDGAAYEDVHSAVEAALATRLGPDTAGRLHTGRSRNDQVATDLRLWAREALVDGVEGAANLAEALLDAAERAGGAVMPGYTHLQRAQPVLLAHHLQAYAAMLERDMDRLRDAYARADVLPLGSAALAGTTYPLDRDLVAQLLGFAAVSRNSLDAVSDRDFVVEHVAALGILAMHLSRLAEELVLWSSAEYGFVRLAESFTTGSSIMPQKRNPDVAELLRGKTGRVYGALVALLTTLKGLPLSYNRDLQEDKAPYFDAVETVHDGLALAAALVSTAEWNHERLAAAAADPLIGATDLADSLVRQGLPFRQAHEVVGRLVRDAETSGRDLAGYSLEELRGFDPRFGLEAVGLGARAMVGARRVAGGTAPERVAEERAAARERLTGWRAWAAERRERWPRADRLLASG